MYHFTVLYQSKYCLTVSVGNLYRNILKRLNNLLCESYNFTMWNFLEPEDHWSCIAHLSAEDMLKSAVIEEKKFKHSHWAGADNPLGPKFLCQQEGLITMVVCCKIKKNLFSL